jgi:hypothetical protein
MKMHARKTGTALEPCWNLPGTLLGTFLATLQAPCLNVAGTLLELAANLLDRRWKIVELCWNLPGTFLEPVLERCRNLPGTLCDLCWKLPGTFLDFCWNLAGAMLEHLCFRFGYGPVPSCDLEPEDKFESFICFFVLLFASFQ